MQEEKGKNNKQAHRNSTACKLFLTDAGQVKLHPSLFLLLLVLGRLYPSPMDGSSSPLSLASFRPFILRLEC
ncbi:thyroid adenoma-associated protein isoform X1 [Tachysurus ichikawai]